MAKPIAAIDRSVINQPVYATFFTVIRFKLGVMVLDQCAMWQILIVTIGFNPQH